MNLTIESKYIEQKFEDFLEAQQTQAYFKEMEKLGIIILNKPNISPQPLLKAVGMA